MKHSECWNGHSCSTSQRWFKMHSHLAEILSITYKKFKPKYLTYQKNTFCDKCETNVKIQGLKKILLSNEIVWYHLLKNENKKEIEKEIASEFEGQCYTEKKICTLGKTFNCSTDLRFDIIILISMLLTTTTILFSILVFDIDWVLGLRF